MKASTAARKLLKMARLEQEAQWRVHSDRERRLRAHHARRARIATNYHRKLMAKAFRAAGIDQSAIDARQQSDARSLQQLLKAERRRLNDNVKDTKGRLDERVQQLSRARIEQLAWVRPDVVIAHLTSATSYFLNSEAALANTSVSLGGLGSNLLRTKPFYQNGETDDGFRGVNCVFQFLWEPPRLGNLNVLSFLAINGDWFWQIGAICGEGGSARTQLSASVSVTQLDSSGIALTESSELVQVFDLDTGWRRESLGAGGGTHFDSISSLPFTNNFIARPGTPLIVSVAVNLNLYWDGTLATQVDFSTNGRLMSVPFVHLMLS